VEFTTTHAQGARRPSLGSRWQNLASVPMKLAHLAMGKTIPAHLPVTQTGKHGAQRTGHVAVSDNDQPPTVTTSDHSHESAQTSIDIGHRFSATPTDLGDVAAGRCDDGCHLGRHQTVKTPMILFSQQGSRAQWKTQSVTNDMGSLDSTGHVAAPQVRRTPGGEALSSTTGLASPGGSEGWGHFVAQHTTTAIAGGLPVAHQGNFEAADAHMASLASGWGSRAVGLVGAVVLDGLVPDPSNRMHPTAWFGNWVAWLERHLWADSTARGTTFTVVALAPPAMLGIVAELATRRHPVARAVATSVTGWVVIGTHSLASEGRAMGESLADDDLAAARTRLPHLCGRVPTDMPESELARGTIESLAENTSDSGVASLWWGAVAGMPGMLVHRGINTLDAMIGHHNSRYENFGRTAARLDDAVNWIPARLTGVLATACSPIVGGSITSTARIMARDARNHPSPNGGWCESAWAGALGITLGGRNVYPSGRIEFRGLLGDGPRPDGSRVSAAATLVRGVMIAATATLAGGCLGIAHCVTAHSRGGHHPHHPRPTMKNLRNSGGGMR
jgi:adenosylcobinamide-phosphate synthase